jgi:hypothetical protein
MVMMSPQMAAEDGGKRGERGERLNMEHGTCLRRD